MPAREWEASLNGGRKYQHRDLTEPQPVIWGARNHCANAHLAPMNLPGARAAGLHRDKAGEAARAPRSNRDGRREMRRPSREHAAAEELLAAVEGEDLAGGEGALGFDEFDFGGGG